MTHLKAGKWLGGGLGWSVAGPVGGVAGFVLGFIIEEVFGGAPKRETALGTFSTSVVIPIAAVLNAGDSVLKIELNYVKRFLRQNFGEPQARKALLFLHNSLHSNIDSTQACLLLRRSLDEASRRQFLRFLFELAAVSGQATVRQQQLLDTITLHFELRAQEASGQSVSRTSDALRRAYAVLGIAPSASTDEIKKAYHAQALRCHPDKLVHADDEARRAAGELFVRLHQSYELIKRERKFS